MNKALNKILSKPDWKINTFPFPHIFTQNVFIRQQYQKLCFDFNSRFSSVMISRERNSEAKLFTVDILEKPMDSLGCFVNPEWIRIIANLFGVPVTTYINMGLHYHSIGSPSTWVHNDLNPGWFIETHDEISFVSRYCNYKNGNSSPHLKKLKVIRSIAMIYYLDNPRIDEISGGCTGLYTSSTSDLRTASILIPPINNSVLIFPCSPVSFHAFLSNTNFCRKSIIMWLHSDSNWAISKWGENAIVPWETTIG